MRRIETNSSSSTFDSKVENLNNSSTKISQSYKDFVNFITIEDYKMMSQNQSEKPKKIRPLNIETPKAVNHVNPLNYSTNYTGREPAKRDPISSYKSVRFAEDRSFLIDSSLDYSISKETVNSSKHDSQLNLSELSTARRNLFPYTKKTKKVKRMQRASRTRSRDPNLPHEYYPTIKSPLRQRFDNSLNISKSGKSSKLNKSKNESFLFKVNSSRSRSKSRTKETFVTPKRILNLKSNKTKSRSKGSKSRSKSTKRRLTYHDIEESPPKNSKIRPKIIKFEDSYSESNSEEREFAFFLREIQELEYKLERAKIELAKCDDFNLLDAFAIFDRTGNGSLHYFDIVDELRRYEMRVTPEDGKLFMHRYDRDKDQRLDFSEFQRAFLPIHKEYRRDLKVRSHLSMTDDRLNGMNAF